MLHDPFSRARLPRDWSREGRVLLLAETFAALVDGRVPTREAALFTGGAGLSWLQRGGTLGSLERDFWRVSAPRRSTLTPARLLAAMGSRPRTTDVALLDTMGSMTMNDPSPSPPQQQQPSLIDDARLRSLIAEEVQRQLEQLVVNFSTNLFPEERPQ